MYQEQPFQNGESGKGYPNIESLKCISKFFSVTIDELLSGEELITLAET